MRDPLNRETIAAAARDILVAEGLHAVSLRRVAGRLGVTAPALYAHVADKRDLLQGIAEQEVEGVLGRFASVSTDDPIETIRLQCHAYLDYSSNNPDLFRAIFLYRPELTSEAPAEGRPPLTARLLQQGAEPVRRAVETGRFGDEIGVDLATLTIWSAVHGAAVLLLSGPALTVELRAQLAESVIDSIIAGLRRGAAVVA